MPTAAKPPKIVRFKSKDGRTVEFGAAKTKQSKAAAARNGVAPPAESTETPAAAPSTSAPSSSKKKSAELGAGAVIAIIGGAVALAAAIGVGAWHWSKKSAPKTPAAPPEPTALRVVA